MPGRFHSGSRNFAAAAGTACCHQPPAAGINPSRILCKPRSALGSGQVGPRSKETPSPAAVPLTPWGPSKSTAKACESVPAASQLMAAASQRLASLALRGVVGRFCTPAEQSALQKSAGFASGNSSRNSSCCCCHWLCRHSSSTSLPACSLSSS